MPQEPEYPTSLGTSDADTISLLGQNLAEDLMGKVGFGELTLWMVTQRRPTQSEVRVFESVLVALADHGFTPTAIAARLTYLSAPDSVQGAIAAGILGGGSRFLGVTEDCGQYLDAVLAAAGEIPADDAGYDALALEAVKQARAAKKFVPGLGHPVHKVRDPRTPRLIEIATEEGLRGPHLRLFEAIGRVHPQVLGRTLPLNGAGVCGAVLADLGLPLDLLRGFALLARTAGLLGQLAEEQRMPIANDIYMLVDRNAIRPWHPSINPQPPHQPHNTTQNPTTPTKPPTPPPTCQNPLCPTRKRPSPCDDPRPSPDVRRKRLPSPHPGAPTHAAKGAAMATIAAVIALDPPPLLLPRVHVNRRGTSPVRRRVGRQDHLVP